MGALPLYMFLRLSLHFVKIVDLVGLTCSIANHTRVVSILPLMQISKWSYIL